MPQENRFVKMTGDNFVKKEAIVDIEKNKKAKPTENEKSYPQLGRPIRDVP